MKTLRTIIVCLLAVTIFTGCCTCPTLCCNHHACTTCTAAVTHADYQTPQWQAGLPRLGLGPSD
jgi:hypothetical protein